MKECSICSHPKVQEIEDAHNSGKGGRSLRSIEREYGLSRSALSRHFSENHTGRPAVMEVSKALVSLESVPMVPSEDSLEQVRKLNAKVLGILSAAETAGDNGTALRAVRESRECIALEARVLGLIGNQNKVDVTNTGISPEEYRKTLGKIIRALEPFPEARGAVLAALDTPEVITIVPNE